MRNFEASRKVLTYRSGRKNRFCEEEIVHLNTTCDGFVGRVGGGIFGQNQEGDKYRNCGEDLHDL